MVSGIAGGVFGAPQSTDAVATALRPWLEWPVRAGCQNGGGREGEGAKDANDLHDCWCGGFELAASGLEKRFVCFLDFLDVGSVCVLIFLLELGG